MSGGDLHILYEDNHLLIVNKPAGVLVQGDRTGDAVLGEVYKSYLKEKYHKPGNVFLQPAHRLDRPVSGCMIFTRTSKATSRVTTAFREQQVSKEYIMISDQLATSPSREIRHWLVKDSRTNTTRAFDRKRPNAKEALLSYHLVGDQEARFLYKVQPRTGRSHQIRVQMSRVGAPIIGDVKYGGIKHRNPNAILLHCSSMTLIHPTTKEPLSVSCQPNSKSEWGAALRLLR
ncbi:MAG: RluA family pseudouridine synthase [Bacteroidota bacterium]